VTAQPDRCDPEWVGDLRRRVVAHLRAQKATQIGLAEYLGVTPKHVNQILKGVTPGTSALLDRMAAAAGLEIVVRDSAKPAPVLGGRRNRRSRARVDAARRQEIEAVRELAAQWRRTAESVASSNPGWSSHFYDCANELEAALAPEEAPG
jgi:transcriptional regulator with XRE-family HTH domain